MEWMCLDHRCIATISGGISLVVELERYDEMSHHAWYKVRFGSIRDSQLYANKKDAKQAAVRLARKVLNSNLDELRVLTVP